MAVCAKCGTVFHPDEGDEERSLGPLAGIGRVFYGLGSEAPLCPRCRPATTS